MGIVNQEARAERARKLLTVPTVLDANALAKLSPACTALLIPALYDNLTHQLKKFPSQLTDAETFTILDCLGVPNGFKSVQVTIAGQTAELEVQFFNKTNLSKIVSDAAAHPNAVKTIFPITGGHRLPAGPATGQVQVTQIVALADPSALKLVVAPIGDYSSYRLGADTVTYPSFDPVFDEIPFKFRPGCFNANCAPDWKPARERLGGPVIDYLAKDYDSFRHTLTAAMMARVPDWDTSSEADLDQVLIDLLSAAADELSDYQDRVMNEAYLPTARKRVSLARHARLMDYHIHQGSQASALIALELDPVSNVDFTLQPGLQIWAGGENKEDAAAAVFVASGAQLHPFVNRLGLYTWSNSIPSLEAGSTTADLKIISAAETKTNALVIQNLIRSGKIKHLLVQEYLEPATGRVNGRDPRKRQLLRLVTGAPAGGKAAKAMLDPLSGKWLVRVNWREEDKLLSNYCFTVECPDLIENVSLFHGNLITAAHGRSAQIVFKEPGLPLTPPNEFFYEATGSEERIGRWGTICRLPQTKSPLAYRNTTPGGDVAPISTLTLKVTPGPAIPWQEWPNFIHSDSSDQNGMHFIIETDENAQSAIRFGNGTNGKALPAGAVVTCNFQYGWGPAGNVGVDTITHVDAATLVLNPAGTNISRCWNPFDVTNGRAPEPAAEIVRRVPEAYRLRQLRAVTLADYVKRAQEVAGVSRAAAAYAWTGSWRTVRLTIDPAGTTTLSDELRRDVARYLEAVRLIGEDLEIRRPVFVPLDIRVTLCADSESWPQDLRFLLEQEFSAGFTSDGRKAFFHPDLWTFGQPLHASQILGRIQLLQGIDHVTAIALKRWSDPGLPVDEITGLRPNEIIEVLSDPNHLERGFIFFEVRGGRQ